MIEVTFKGKSRGLSDLASGQGRDGWMDVKVLSSALDFGRDSLLYSHVLIYLFLSCLAVILQWLSVFHSSSMFQKNSDCRDVETCQ